MGTWVMEVCKMGMYITFPVALFYIFNQPAYFEEWVIKKQRELYPPDHLSHHEKLQQAIRNHHKELGAEMQKTLEKLENK